MRLSSATPVPKALTTATRPARSGSTKRSPERGAPAGVRAQALLARAAQDDVDGPAAVAQDDPVAAAGEVPQADERQPEQRPERLELPGERALRAVDQHDGVGLRRVWWRGGGERVEEQRAGSLLERVGVRGEPGERRGQAAAQGERDDDHRRRPDVVLEDEPGPVRAPDDVRPAEADADRRGVDADEVPLEVAAGVEDRRRHDARGDGRARAVRVGDPGVEGARALGDPGRERIPLRPGDDAGDGVDGEAREARAARQAERARLRGDPGGDRFRARDRERLEDGRVVRAGRAGGVPRLVVGRIRHVGHRREPTARPAPGSPAAGRARRPPPRSGARGPIRGAQPHIGPLALPRDPAAASRGPIRGAQPHIGPLAPLRDPAAAAPRRGRQRSACGSTSSSRPTGVISPSSIRSAPPGQ